MKWPSCGVAGCDSAAVYVDKAGVGFCPECAGYAMESDSIRRACDVDDFDLDWLDEMNLMGFTAARPEVTK